MNEAQIEKYQAGNKSFGLVGSAPLNQITELANRIVVLEYAVIDKDKRIAELEVQVPKVVAPHNAENAAWLAWWRCDCGDIVLFDAKYCQECGAKLDWTEVNHE